jgi:putative membrane protein
VSWLPALLVSGALLAGYGLALRRRPTSLRGWPAARTLAWTAGALAVAAALSPALTELAHHDHRAHMGQHLLLGMYAPLGLVLGAPVELVLGAVSRDAARTATRVLRAPVLGVLAHPITAAVLNVGGMFVLYLTPLYELTAIHAWAHALVLTHFLLAGCLYTWAIAGRGPGPRRPRLLVRAGVLVVAAGAHAYLAKLLYARADAHAGHGAGHGAGTMQEAAQWMYYGGDVAEILLAVMLFSAWYRHTARWRLRTDSVPRTPRGDAPFSTSVVGGDDRGL